MRPLLLLSLCVAACAGPGPDSPVGPTPQAGPGLIERLARAAAPEASAPSPAPVTPEPPPAPPGPRIITESECLTDASDRIRSQTEPPRYDHLHLTVRHMGKTGSAERIGQVANAVSWDVGNYTGLVVPAPREPWQRGFYDAGPPHGTNAFQVHCTSAGSMINSWSFDHTEEVVGGGPHSAWEISFSQPTTPFGAPSSALVLEADLAVPWIASWNGGVGQLSFFVYLRERTSDRVFAYVLGAFDNRPLGDQAGFEFLGHDTFVSFVSSALVPGGRYSTTAPGDPAFRSTAFAIPEHFRVAITAQQLLHAIDDLNAKGDSTPLPREPSDYLLIATGVLHEIYVGTSAATNLSMGALIDRFTVSETR